MRLLQALCLSLLIGTGSCANPPAPNHAEISGSSRSTAPQRADGLAGRITDEENRAVEGASVLAAPLGPGEPAVPEMTIVSDAEGRYEWPLRAGRYEITVVADGYERVSKTVTVSVSERATLDFVLPRNRRTRALSLRPTIRDANARPDGSVVNLSNSCDRILYEFITGS